MEIVVNGVKKELYIGCKNGVDCARDLIGNDENLVYNEDAEQYEMSEEAFEWWEALAETINEVTELEDELSTEQWKVYDAENFNYCDIDAEYDARLDFLRELVK